MKNSFSARCTLSYAAGLTKGRVYTIVNVETVPEVMKFLNGFKKGTGDSYVLLNDNLKFISVPANCFEKINY